MLPAKLEANHVSRCGPEWFVLPLTLIHLPLMFYIELKLILVASPAMVRPTMAAPVVQVTVTPGSSATVPEAALALVLEAAALARTHLAIKRACPLLQCPIRTMQIWKPAQTHEHLMVSFAVKLATVVIAQAVAATNAAVSVTFQPEEIMETVAVEVPTV